MVVTAENITDEQIEALRVESCECRPFPLGSAGHAAQHDCDVETYELCNVALFDLHGIDADERRLAARARCAAILNARQNGGVK